MIISRKLALLMRFENAVRDSGYLSFPKFERLYGVPTIEHFKELILDEFNKLELKALEEEKQIGILAHCKKCKQPRLIIEGSCPGCMKKGSIVFDPEINIIKEMTGKL